MTINCELTLKVISKLQENNIKCYVVGGYVRDSLLKKNSKDIDIELHNTTAEDAYEIITSVAPANYYGKFGIIALEDVNTEFAVARREIKSGNLHTDFDVEFITNGDLKLAASRRDFTINSMMYDLQTNQLIDFYNGQEDLTNKVLRHVSSKFVDDPLRILRGIKFIARYNLIIDEKTDELCQKIIFDLMYLPKSRIENEISAIFNAEFFRAASPLLAKYLGLLFNQELRLNDVNCSNFPEVEFFRQFPDYEQVIEFCFEQKRIKRDLIFILNHYEDIVNYRNLSGVEMYNLFKNLRYVEEYAYSINNNLKKDYVYYLQLCQKYNGAYYLSKGYSGKQISNEQSRTIGGLLDEL